MTDIPPLVHLARELTLARQWADRLQSCIDNDGYFQEARTRQLLSMLDRVEAAIVEARKVL